MGWYEQIAVNNIRNAQRRASMSPARRWAGNLATGLGWMLLRVMVYAPLWLPLVLLIAWWWRE